MAEQQSAEHEEKQETDSGNGKNGQAEEAATYEQELADYLQERIKPGLNSGAIPMLARSIAKDIAKRAAPADASENGNGAGTNEDAPKADNDEDAPKAEGDTAEAAANALPDFEAEM